MKDEQAKGIDIVQELILREINAEPMHEADRADPPRDMLIHEKRRHDEKTRSVVDEESFLTDGFGSVNGVFDGHIVDVEDPGDEEEDAG